MVQLGVLPTKTTIELREPDGDAGTIPAATEASAGVMTAAHVKMLMEVYLLIRQFISDDDPGVVALRPLAAQAFQRDISDMPLPRTALPAPAGPDVVSALETRLNTMEQRISQMETRPHGREVVRVESTAVEKLPQPYVDQLAQITRDLEKFKDSQEFVLPNSFAELVQRVATLEQRPVDITPAAAATPDLVVRIEAVEEFITAFDELRGRQAGSLQLIHDLMEMVIANRKTADGQAESIRGDVKRVKQEIILMSDAIQRATA